MPTQFRPNRRHVLTTAAVGLASTPLLTARSVLAANEEVRLGFIGAGGRAGELSRTFDKCSNAKLVAFADPDQDRAKKLADNFNATSSSDLRSILDNPQVDAVVIATCNHWHCLAAQWAMDAGKHVYVEKPLSHSQWEGRQIVNQAAKSGKVVQIGTQQRSDPLQQQAKDFLHKEKGLGKILYVQANRLGPRASIGRRDTPLTPPNSVDYDLWLGPAADEPMLRENFHYDWHWNYNTGSGEMGNWGVHILDDIRNVAYQDSVTTPSKILAAGGRLGWDDAGTTPNVHFALFETSSFPTLIALSNLPASKNDKAAWKCPVRSKINGPGSGYIVVCENGYYLGQRGRGEALDLDGRSIRKFNGGDVMKLHTQNFIDSVIANDPAKLNGGIINGHNSTGWCNLANIAFEAGEQYDRAALMQASTMPAWNDVMNQMEQQLSSYSPKLEGLRSCPMLQHDPASEQFFGANADRANPLLKRRYRADFEVKAFA